MIITSFYFILLYSFQVLAFFFVFLTAGFAMIGMQLARHRKEYLVSFFFMSGVLLIALSRLLSFILVVTGTYFSGSVWFVPVLIQGVGMVGFLLLVFVGYLLWYKGMRP